MCWVFLKVVSASCLSVLVWISMDIMEIGGDTLIFQDIHGYPWIQWPSMISIDILWIY